MRLIQVLCVVCFLIGMFSSNFVLGVISLVLFLAVTSLDRD